MIDLLKQYTDNELPPQVKEKLEKADTFQNLFGNTFNNNNLKTTIENETIGINKRGKNEIQFYLYKSCGAEEEKEIAIKDYDEEKEKQVCSSCGGKMQRLLEWWPHCY